MRVERYEEPAAGWRPLGRALAAYHGGRSDAVLTVHREDGVVEEVPVAVFFRDEAAMEPWERRALEAARGRVLDVGAGAGCHALALQERGLEVTALEALPRAVRVLRERGVERVVRGTLQAFEPERPFDTVLLLMSGSGLAGTLGGLDPLLRALERVAAPGGQVFLDSTDLQEDGRRSAPSGARGATDIEAEGPGSRGAANRRAGADGTAEVEGSPGSEEGPDGRYVGELHYQLEFDGERGPPFPHLFVDPELLARRARRVGWRSEVVWRDEAGRFLARLERAACQGLRNRTTF